MTREDWFKTAVKVLANEGFTALKIDVMKTKLGVTKGSFYHHFKSLDDFKEKLLEYFEHVGTLNIIKDVEDTNLSPHEKLTLLCDIVLSYPGRIEVAIRAWAWQDEQVLAYQQGVDARRQEYMTALFIDLDQPPDTAQTLARLMLTLLVGGEQLGMSTGEIRQLFNAVLTHYGIQELAE